VEWTKEPEVMSTGLVDIVNANINVECLWNTAGHEAQSHHQGERLAFFYLFTVAQVIYSSWLDYFRMGEHTPYPSSRITKKVKTRLVHDTTTQLLHRGGDGNRPDSLLHTYFLPK
jgi:hypothetical protein